MSYNYRTPQERRLALLKEKLQPFKEAIQNLKTDDEEVRINTDEQTGRAA